MLNVENKVITITGASSGIGEASARLLAQNGANVVLGARRTQKLEKIVEEIRSSGGTAIITRRFAKIPQNCTHPRCDRSSRPVCCVPAG